MTGYWGYNEGSNEPPLTQDPLRGEPDILPFWQRALLAALSISVVVGFALLAERFL